MTQFNLVALRHVLHGEQAVVGARSRRRQPSTPVWTIDRQEILDDLYYRGGR